MHLSQLLVVSALGGLVTAAPVLAPREQQQAATLIAGVLKPGASCPAGNGECRTAAQAAPFLIDAFQSYGVYTYGEIAAVLALIGYESGDFTYKHNVSPGRAGQGTSNMQMVNYNAEFAASFPELKAKASSLSGSTPDGANAILALVQDDKYNFKSGPWFLTTKCASVRSALQKGTDDGWRAYMGCVGVDPSDAGRLAYWTRAKTAFGL